MKKLTLIAFFCLTVVPPLFAAELGHYSPGVMNIRDYFVPAPGWYGVVYNVFYTSDTLRDKNGDKVKSININLGLGPGVVIDVDVDVNVYSVVPTLIWVTPWELPCGWRYGAYIAPTFANNSISAALSTEAGFGIEAEEGQFGVGDLFVQPLWLGWSGKHWDFALGYGFYAPIGRYDTQKVRFPRLGLTVTSPAADNIGLGFWTHQFQTSLGWYPWENRGTLIMLGLTGEVHSKKQDIDVTPGANMALNWGISQYLPLKKDNSLMLEIGATGYCQWQVTDDRGSAVRNPDVHDRVYAAGGQLGVLYVPWDAFFEARYLHEFGAIDRFEGQMLTFTLGKKF